MFCIQVCKQNLNEYKREFFFFFFVLSIVTQIYLFTELVDKK